MTAQPATTGRMAGRLAAIYPYLILALSMLMWSGNWVVGRALRDTVPPVAMTFWRWVVAVLVMAPFALPHLKGKGAVLRRSWRLLLGLALTGGSLFQVAVYFGLHHTQTINAVLMNSAGPLFILLASWIVDGQRATLRQVVGMLISFGGVLVIMTRGHPSQLQSLHFNIGDLAIFAAMPLWAVYFIMLRRKPPEIDNLGLIFVIGVVGLALLAPAYALESLYIKAAPFSWAMTGGVLYTGLFASVGAYVCYARGTQMVGPNRAGFTMHLVPAFATVEAVLLLGEEVHLFHVIGIATILFGIWLATSRGRASRAASARPAR